MSLTSFFRRSHSQRNKRQASYAGASRRPRFETFEDRRMLSLTAAGDYPTIGTPSTIVTADFNNDGQPDLATCANAGTGSFSVLLGDGAGGFGAAQRTVIGANLSSMAVADFNSDGDVDIVLADTSYSALHLLKGNGDGTFQPAVTQEQWGYLSEAATGDFNNDGKADLLVRIWEWDNFNDMFQVRLGDGTGGFGDSYFLPRTWDTHAPYMGIGLATVDLNRDGLLDMVTADVDAYLGNGNGTLQAGIHSPALGQAVATGDFTGDGNADVISVGSGVLSVLRGEGDGTFHQATPHSANGTNHTAVATADFNGDGKLDAIVTDSNVGTANVLLGNVDGTLRYGGTFVTGTSPSGVVVGDYNGDGRPDVAVSNAGSKNVSVLLNDGDWTTVPLPPPALSISNTTITEGDTGTLNATFVVSLSQPVLVDVTIRYDTANMTATAATDYVTTSDALTIPAGQTSRAFTVPIKSDILAESTETFAVNLSNPTNAVIADGQGIGTIFDNDPQPAISMNDVRATEGNSKTTLFTFTVTLSAASSQAVTVNYATANGTATAGSDYQWKTGSLTFAPGETTKTITVAVNGDKLKEADETLLVSLSGAVGGVITDGQALGTILNDDGGGPKGRASSSSLAVDEAIEDLMFPGRKKRSVSQLS